MSKKQTVVAIVFDVEVSFSRAREIVKNLCDRSASRLAYKKYGTIRRENITRWRKEMSCVVGYSGKGKRCRALCSFLKEEDAILFENYINVRLRKNREFNTEIILVE